MRHTLTIILLPFFGLLAVYVIIVSVVDYETYVAPMIQFGRVALALTTLILYVPALSYIFREVPAPRRDYLVAGIILSAVSGLGFSISNQAMRLIPEHYDASVLTGVLPGALSLILVAGWIFHILAPDMTRRRRLRAILWGFSAGLFFVVVIPLIFAFHD